MSQGCLSSCQSALWPGKSYVQGALACSLAPRGSVCYLQVPPAEDGLLLKCGLLEGQWLGDNSCRAALDQIVGTILQAGSSRVSKP